MCGLEPEPCGTSTYPEVSYAVESLRTGAGQLSCRRRLPARSATTRSLSATEDGTSPPERASCELSSRPATVVFSSFSISAAAARRASVCSRSRRCSPARISRTSRAEPASAKLICSGIASPACSQMASAAAGSHSAIDSSTTTAENSRRRNAASAALRLSAISTAIPNCVATASAQLRAPSIPVTIRMLIPDSPHRLLVAGCDAIPSDLPNTWVQCASGSARFAAYARRRRSIYSLGLNQKVPRSGAGRSAPIERPIPAGPYFAVLLPRLNRPAAGRRCDTP